MSILVRSRRTGKKRHTAASHAETSLRKPAPAVWFGDDYSATSLQEPDTCT